MSIYFIVSYVHETRIYFVVSYVHETCAYILSCIMFTRHAHLFYVILSTFSTRSISLVAANNASVSLFMFYVYVFAKRIIIISPEQILQSLI